MHTVWIRIYCSLSIISLLFLAGCSSSGSSTTSQEVFFSEYGMTIHNNFIALNPTSLVDRRFNGSIVAAYSMPTSQQNIFEKNIVVMEDDLGTFTFQEYVDQSIAGIQKTWGGYSKSSLSTDEVDCNTSKLPAIYHNFTILRGGLSSTGQTIYFMQYFFAKGKKIFILSSSTDNKDDLDALTAYKDSIRCLTGTITTS